MREIDSVDELKNIQLKIMDNVHSFCEDNGIRYFLAYGSLLGAIRHKGYIPWDDDVDIAMPRHDYDKFKDLYNKKSSVYKMVCFENDKSYELPFGKVIDIRTKMIEPLYKQNDYMGVYIDVFPIDAYVNKKQVEDAHRLRRELNVKKAQLAKGRSLMKDCVLFLGKLFLWRKSVKSILHNIDSLCRSGNVETASLVGYLPSLNKDFRDIIEKDTINKTCLAEFEGRKYRIPVGYDQYLRQQYGDYMMYPPIEKRISTHIFKAWWK